MNNLARPDSTPNQPQRLLELEGLRSWLAWWVVIGHFLIEAGWNAAWAPTLGRFLLNPGLAVRLFVILSGFVITLLLDKGKPGYGAFITGRFFRLFPLYYVMLAAGILALPWACSFYPSYLAHIGSPSGLFELHHTWEEHLARMPAYFAACLVGSHGAMPNSWLPDAQNAFVSQAWSISLEWQFYLVAPLLALALRTRRGLVALGIAFYVVIGTRRFYDIGGWSSFLPQNIECFALGAISYFAYKHLRLEDESTKYYARMLFFVMVLAIGFVPFFTTVVFLQWPRFSVTDLGLPVGIWLVMMSLVIARKHAAQHPFVQLVSLPFTNRINVYLGRISYSTYLCHYFVINLLQWAMLRLAPQYINKWSMLFVFCTVGVLMVLAISALSHRFIEVPGLALGKRITSKRAPSSA